MSVFYAVELYCVAQVACFENTCFVFAVDLDPYQPLYWFTTVAFTPSYYR